MCSTKPRSLIQKLAVPAWKHPHSPNHPISSNLIHASINTCFCPSPTSHPSVHPPTAPRVSSCYPSSKPKVNICSLEGKYNFQLPQLSKKVCRYRRCEGIYNCMGVCLFACLLVCLSVCFVMFLCLFVCLLACLLVCLFVCLFV